jgi:5-methylcytosine-specific restriction endonuclease McrA
MSKNITTGNKMFYDATWYRLRQRIFKRDGYKCRVCGDGEGLTVHHITPRSEGGTDDPENLITLCDECHSRIHKIERAAKAISSRRYIEEYAL